MIHYRERSKCRSALINLTTKYHCSIYELLHHKLFSLSDGLRLQARKMLQEEKQQQLIDSIQYITVKGEKYPIMLCEEYRGIWRFFCPFCLKYHSHGAIEGHRMEILKRDLIIFGGTMNDLSF